MFLQHPEKAISLFIFFVSGFILLGNADGQTMDVCIDTSSGPPGSLGKCRCDETAINKVEDFKERLSQLEGW